VCGACPRRRFIDFLQDAQRPQGDVFEIADRRADKIKAAGVCRFKVAAAFVALVALGEESSRSCSRV